MKKQTTQENEGILATYHFEPCIFVSMDQFMSITPGQHNEGIGREGAKNHFHDGTIFNDAGCAI